MDTDKNIETVEPEDKSKPFYICFALLFLGTVAAHLMLPMAGYYQKMYSFKSPASTLLNILDRIPFLVFAANVVFTFVYWGNLKKSSIIFSGAIAASIIIYGLVFSTGDFSAKLSNPYNDMAFEYKIWMKNKTSLEPYNPRGKMAASVVTRLHKKVEAKDVITILGKPNGTLVHEEDQSFTMSYFLGYYSSKEKMDSLEISFDKTGALLDYKIKVFD